MSEHLGQLELVAVDTKDSGIELTFLNGESIRTVKLNKQSYNSATKKWENSEEQSEKFANNIREYLHVEPENVMEAIGQKFDVWETENFCALWEIKTLAKFPADWAGQILTAEIVDIKEYDAKAVIVLSFEGKEYGSNINYGSYVASMKKSLVDPQKKKSQMEKFEEKFMVPFSERETLIGKDVMIEVKKNNMDSTGNNPTYIEVKALPKAMPK